MLADIKSGHSLPEKILRKRGLGKGYRFISFTLSNIPSLYD
jgi:hypothetical protein